MDFFKKIATIFGPKLWSYLPFTDPNRINGSLIRFANPWSCDKMPALKKDSRRLEAEVTKRTEQIEADKRDITSHFQVLQELHNAKTKFFSNITHEFRTSLTLIIGPLQQIITEQPPPTIFRRRMGGILKNAQHLLSLINQLLDLSKMEGGQMKVEVTRGDIVAYTQELVKRFQYSAPKKSLNLSFISNLDRWETHFDQDKWDKIIYNLLSNAIKFTSPGEAIQISLMKTHKDLREFIRLDVKDTGIGIEKKQIRLIFNRFYQVDKPACKQEGTGIGLALVKELLTLQGGEIQVASELKRGTSFEIHLPVLEFQGPNLPVGDSTSQALPLLPFRVDEGPDRDASLPSAGSAVKLELLIIDDNEEIREYIRYCVDTAKYNITEAGDGEEGLQKAQALIPDLIISDVMMPKKDGFDLTQAIRENISTSHIPLILLTAKASSESRLEGLHRGADAYLTKPFSPQELALRIEKLIEIRYLLQQRYQHGISLAIPSATDNNTFQREDSFLVELKEYILQNIDESGLNGDLIGKHFGMSRVHLHRKLKAVGNLSISELVKSVRLEKALELIRQRQFNLSEIGYQTGFSSISHFSRSFKSHFGKAPSEV